MHKETSSRVSGIASRLIHISPATLIGERDKGHSHIENLCEDIRALAGSCMSQDETPGVKPQTFLDRLHLERIDLSAKLDGLTKFFERGAPGVSDTQRHLLESQRAAMTLYLKTLDLRLQDLALQPRPIEETFDHKTTHVASEQPIGEAVETGGHDESRDGPVPFGD